MSQASEVTRTRRVEVVDDAGAVRVVIGQIAEGEHGMFGVAVCDGSGSRRVWMLHDGPNAEVGLSHAGNVVAALSVAFDGAPGLFLDE